MWFCDECGAETSHGDALAGAPPACPTHGPRWRLVRNAPCAAAIVVRDGQVLLGKRAKEPFAGLWEVPGGFVERGEHPTDAAIREVQEELGVNVTLTGLVGIYLEHTSGGETLQVTVFEGTTPDEVAHPDHEEMSDWGWFEPEDIPRDLAGRHRLRIDDWLDGRSVQLPADGLT